MKVKLINIIKSFVMVLFRFINYFYSYSTMRKLSLILSNLYSYWIANEFISFGDKSIINYPLVLRGGEYISIGKNTSIGKRAILTAWDKQNDLFFSPEISIGNKVSIGEDCHITAINKIVISNNVLMGKKITITDNSHGNTNFDTLQTPPNQRPWFSKGPVIIENNVWIGDKATILGGVTIGENSVIGANAVVTSNIPPNCVAWGIPARVIKNCN